ncbi:XkdQ/YqbQ family protein [Bacillus sp. JJ1503]|uniref:XkdQ/YqbQ family protein n=1 Tax=Bacillus sp. JJ1503 TaxID=3122956 RepID=UPI003F68B36D
MTSVDWSGHSEKPNRQITLSLKNTLDGRSQEVEFLNGGRIEFRNHSKVNFIGVIFSTDISENGDMHITAYDENIYLLKSVETRKFSKMKASDIAKRLCADFGIPAGQIADTGYVIPTLICREKSLYEILLMALTVTRNQTGKRFFIWSKNGRLMITTGSGQVSKYMIEAGTNILNANYSQSIEETKTRVKVFGGKDGKFVASARNGTLENEIGIMQVVEKMNEDATKSQVEQRAKQLLKERAVIDDQATVTALGIDEIITGTAVYVREPMTGIIGGYYVTNDSHRYENGSHIMTLQLSHTYDLPSIEVTKEELGVVKQKPKPAGRKRSSKTNSADEKARK